jgi:hypothetical protein
MPRSCTVCLHPQLHDINVQLAIEANSNRQIASQFGLNEAAIRRHRANHLPREVVKARQVQEGLSADAIWKQLHNINTVTLNIIKSGWDRGDYELVLRAISRIERQSELIMKLLGELNETPQVNVMVVNSPQWVNIRTTLLQALRPYPDARAAVAKALQKIEG